MILFYLSFFGFMSNRAKQCIVSGPTGHFQKQPNTRHHQTATNKVAEAQSNQSPVLQMLEYIW
jgi:hypothetical protein